MFSTVFGDISLDLSDSVLPEGETDLTLLCWVGTIQMRVPRDVGIDVTAQAMVSTLDVLGRREGGWWATCTRAAMGTRRANAGCACGSQRSLASCWS